MKLINVLNGEVLAEVTTNHSMSIDEVIELMNWQVDGDGNMFDEDGWIGCYEDLEIVY